MSFRGSIHLFNKGKSNIWDILRSKEIINVKFLKFASFLLLLLAKVENDLLKYSIRSTIWSKRCQKRIAATLFLYLASCKIIEDW